MFVSYISWLVTVIFLVPNVFLVPLPPFSTADGNLLRKVQIKGQGNRITIEGIGEGNGRTEALETVVNLFEYAGQNRDSTVKLLASVTRGEIAEEDSTRPRVIDIDFISPEDREASQKILDKFFDNLKAQFRISNTEQGTHEISRDGQIVFKDDPAVNRDPSRLARQQPVTTAAPAAVAGATTKAPAAIATPAIPAVTTPPATAVPVTPAVPAATTPPVAVVTTPAVAAVTTAPPAPAAVVATTAPAPAAIVVTTPPVAAVAGTTTKIALPAATTPPVAVITTPAVAAVPTAAPAAATTPPAPAAPVPTTAAAPAVVVATTPPVAAVAGTTTKISLPAATTPPVAGAKAPAVTALPTAVVAALTAAPVTPISVVAAAPTIPAIPVATMTPLPPTAAAAIVQPTTPAPNPLMTAAPAGGMCSDCEKSAMSIPNMIQNLIRVYLQNACPGLDANVILITQVGGKTVNMVTISKDLSKDFMCQK